MRNGTKFINFKDIVEENGKTIEQNNLEIKHKFNIGDLIEITEEGSRAFIALQTRDCDGTPLYSLSLSEEWLTDPCYKHYYQHGYNQNDLILVKKKKENLNEKD